MKWRPLSFLIAAVAISASAAIASYETTCFQTCQVDSTGYTLIKSAEGYSPFVYKDSVGVPTVGFGHALLPGEHIKTPLMGPDALNLLKNDVGRRTAALNALIRVPLTQNQVDALTSLLYNIGIGNFKRSTLLKRVNAGRHKEVPPQFLLWDKAGGEVLPGLHARRKVEAMLYARGTLE